MVQLSCYSVGRKRAASCCGIGSAVLTTCVLLTACGGGDKAPLAKEHLPTKSEKTPFLGSAPEWNGNIATCQAGMLSSDYLAAMPETGQPTGHTYATTIDSAVNGQDATGRAHCETAPQTRLLLGSGARSGFTTVVFAATTSCGSWRKASFQLKSLHAALTFNHNGKVTQAGVAPFIKLITVLPVVKFLQTISSLPSPSKSPAPNAET